MAAQRVAIVGVGTSEFAREIADKTTMQLRIEATKKAVDDAGLALKDLDGILCGEGGNPYYDNRRHHMEFSEMLGLYETPICMTIPMGGATAGACIDIARWALETGRSKYVLIVSGSKESGTGRSARGHAFTDRLARLEMHYPDYEWPYGPLMPSFYGLVAQRHMHEYSTTEEELASYSVAIRYNASLNPDAVYRTPITVDDVLSSRMISSPLHMLHCCMVNDGAVAFVMTTEERAKDLKQEPVYVLGCGGGQAGYWTGFLANGGADKGYSLVRTMAKRAADDAFGEAGISRDDVDLVTCCDNFAITPLVQVEDYGFCAKGEGGPFAGEDGSRLRVGGELPLNTHGGLLSCNHAATNFQNPVEVAIQLRGHAGDRQVQGAKIGFAGTSAGIISTHYVAILGTD